MSDVNRVALPGAAIFYGQLFFSTRASCILFPSGDTGFAIHIRCFGLGMQRLSLSMYL